MGDVLIELERSLTVRHNDEGEESIKSALERIEAGLGKMVTWSEILESYQACLLVGSANTGKSCELHLLNERLRASGKTSFLWPLRLLYEERALEDLLSREEQDALYAWRSSPTAAATFLLDSIDEAELCRVGAFEVCLRRIRKFFDADALRRATWVISTRPGAWSSLELGGLVQSELCFCAPVLSVSLNDDGETSNVAGEVLLPSKGVVVAGLCPLTGEQTATLLKDAFRVENIQGYEQFAYNLGLSFALESPGELKWFASLLDAEPRPKSRVDAMELASRELVTGRKGVGSSDRDALICEVSRICAAAELCDATLMARREAERTAGSLPLRELLAHKAPSFEDELCALPLVSDSGASQVKFVPKHIQTYLAAKWLSSRTKSVADEHALAEIFIQPSFVGKIVLSKSMTLVGWLATMCPSFRARILEIAPAAVLFLGDLTRIHLVESKRALSAVVQATVAGRPLMSSELHLTGDDYWQVAIPELATDLCAALDENRSNELCAGLLLQIFEARRLEAAVPSLRRYISDGPRDSELDIFCLDAIEVCGNAFDVLWAIDEILSRLRPNDESAHRLALALLKAGGDVGKFVKLCLTLSSHEFGVAHRFERACGHVPAERSLRFIASLLDFVEQDTPVVDPEAVAEEPRGHSLVDIGLAMLKGVLSQNDLRTSDHLAVLVVLERIHATLPSPPPHDRYDDIPELMEKLPALREQALERLVNRLPVDEVYQVQHNSYAYVRVSMADHELLKAMEQRARTDEARASIHRLVERSTPQTYVATAAPAAPASAKRTEQIAKDRASLARDLAELRSASNLQKLTRAALLAAGESRSRWSNCDWTRFETRYGVDVREAVQDGLKLLWRREPPLSEQSNPNSTYHQTVAGLIGLMTELTSKSAVKALSIGESRRAMEYALFEMNQYPGWMSVLSSEHPGEVAQFLAETVQRWADSPLARSDAEHVVQRIQELFSVAVPSVVSRALWQAASVGAWSNSYDLGRVLEICADEPSLRQVYKETCAARTSEAWTSRDQGTFVTWFTARMRSAPTDTIGWLEQTWSNDPADTNLLLSAASNWYNSEPKGIFDFPGLSAEEQCSLLSRLFAVMVKAAPYIPFEMRHAPREQTPSEMANRMRDNIPARIRAVGGFAAFEAFRKICESAVLGDWELRAMHRFAYAVAEDNAQRPPWSLHEFLAYSSRSELPMRDERGTFKVVLQDVDEVVRNLQEGDFSNRTMLLTCSEKDMQFWMARELQLLSRGRYELVREPEKADNTAPDIVVTGPLKHRVTLELKLADNRTVDTLLSDLKRQLHDDYLKAQNANFGVFAVMWKEELDLPKRGAARQRFEQVQEALVNEADSLMLASGYVKHIAVRCFICPPAASPRNEERKAKSSLRRPRSGLVRSGKPTKSTRPAKRTARG